MANERPVPLGADLRSPPMPSGIATAARRTPRTTRNGSHAMVTAMIPSTIEAVASPFRGPAAVVRCASGAIAAPSGSTYRRPPSATSAVQVRPLWNRWA